MSVLALPETSATAVEWALWSTTARIVVTDPTGLARARTIADEYLAEVERAASRFRPDSEVCRLHPGADGSVIISATLADLVAEALWAARFTDGTVDPTVGTTMLALGYDRDLSRVDPDLPWYAAPAPGWDRLRLRGRRLWLPDGVLLDLGATAKAVAADRLAQRLHRRLGAGVLVSLGGDIATAGAAPRGQWQVEVVGQTSVGLPGGLALATSSTARRTWTRAGRRLHHIVDPATGEPAAPYWRNVTVAADTCVQANTISTAAVVRGVDALRWMEGLGVAARLERLDGDVVRTGGWPV